MKTEASTDRPLNWRRVAAVVPGVGATLLPVGACPACWPAYAGFLSSIGLGFLFDGAYLLPIAGVFLAVALAGLAYGASTRRGYAPFALGTAGAAVALCGKFALASDTLLYVGLAVLTAAAFWNAWPPRAAATGSCSACARQDQGTNTQAHTKEVLS